MCFFFPCIPNAFWENLRPKTLGSGEVDTSKKHDLNGRNVGLLITVVLMQTSHLSQHQCTSGTAVTPRGKTHHLLTALIKSLSPVFNLFKDYSFSERLVVISSRGTLSCHGGVRPSLCVSLWKRVVWRAANRETLSDTIFVS